MLTRTQFMTINNDWKNSGLKLPSVIRIHKIATLEKDMDRDYFMSAEEALKYGIIDKIIEAK